MSTQKRKFVVFLSNLTIVKFAFGKTNLLFPLFCSQNATKRKFQICRFLSNLQKIDKYQIWHLSLFVKFDQKTDKFDDKFACVDTLLCTYCVVRMSSWKIVRLLGKRASWAPLSVQYCYFIISCIKIIVGQSPELELVVRRSWSWNAVKRRKIYEPIEFLWQQSESVKHMGALLLLIDCSYSFTLTSSFSHSISIFYA